MNIPLKTNSRFSSLAPENNQNDFRRQHTNRNVSEPRENTFQRLTYGERIMREKALYEQKKIKEQEQKAADLLKSLTDANSFPELSKPVSQTTCTLNFADKVNTLRTEEDSNDWKPIENKSKAKYGLARRSHATPDEIMGALVERYEKWKAEYIELYGYDDYEHTFRFSDWDYEYFDKLDEKYEYEMMLEEQENEQDNDYMEYEQNAEYIDE